MYKISYIQPKFLPKIDLPLSKSLSNRLRVLQYLYPNSISVEEWSDAEDSTLLIDALEKNLDYYNFGLAGTSIRFFLAVAALEGRACTLDASERGRERPIKPLIDSLILLGARIIYLQKDGFLPIRLLGGEKLKGGSIAIDASVSSQFITALLLIGPKMEKGLQLNLKHQAASSSYWKMSCILMNNLGFEIIQQETRIDISHVKSILTKNITIESDWSSAAYPIQTVLETHSQIQIRNLNANSFQPDAVILKILKPLGLRFEQVGPDLMLWMEKQDVSSLPSLDASSFPDLAISMAVLFSSLGIKCKLSGLQTLDIKESKRFSHLYASLSSLSEISLDEQNFSLDFQKQKSHSGPLLLQTENDHRFVMAFTPLAYKFDLRINEYLSVVKSFPNFWKEMVKLGFYHEKLN